MEETGTEALLDLIQQERTWEDAESSACTDQDTNRDSNFRHHNQDDGVLPLIGDSVKLQSPNHTHDAGKESIADEFLLDLIKNTHTKSSFTNNEAPCVLNKLLEQSVQLKSDNTSDKVVKIAFGSNIGQDEKEIKFIERIEDFDEHTQLIAILNRLTMSIHGTQDSIKLGKAISNRMKSLFNSMGTQFIEMITTKLPGDFDVDIMTKIFLECTLEDSIKWLQPLIHFLKLKKRKTTQFFKRVVESGSNTFLNMLVDAMLVNITKEVQELSNVVPCFLSFAPEKIFISKSILQYIEIFDRIYVYQDHMHAYVYKQLQLLSGIYWKRVMDTRRYIWTFKANCLVDGINIKNPDGMCKNDYIENEKKMKGVKKSLEDLIDENENAITAVFMFTHGTVCNAESINYVINYSRNQMNLAAAYKVNLKRILHIITNSYIDEVRQINQLDTHENISLPHSIHEDQNLNDSLMDAYHIPEVGYVNYLLRDPSSQRTASQPMSSSHIFKSLIEAMTHVFTMAPAKAVGSAVAFIVNAINNGAQKMGNSTSSSENTHQKIDRVLSCTDIKGRQFKGAQLVIFFDSVVSTFRKYVHFGIRFLLNGNSLVLFCLFLFPAFKTILNSVTGMNEPRGLHSLHHIIRLANMISKILLDYVSPKSIHQILVMGFLQFIEDTVTEENDINTIAGPLYGIKLTKRLRSTHKSHTKENRNNVKTA